VNGIARSGPAADIFRAWWDDGATISGDPGARFGVPLDRLTILKRALSLDDPGIQAIGCLLSDAAVEQIETAGADE
jgi:hypothetical protein